MFRVLSLRSYQTRDNLPQYLAVGNGIQLASGCDAIFLKRYAEYSCLYGDCEVKADACIPINDVKYPKMVDLMNVKYVVSSMDLNDSSMEFVLGDAKTQLYKNKDYMERAFFATRFKNARSDEVLSFLTDKNFEPRDYVILEDADDLQEITGLRVYKGVRITKYSQNKVVIEDDFEADGIVVLSDVNYPSWKAYVDGKETKIYNANYIMKAVYVDKGNHKIEFTYMPLYYKTGLYLSGFSVIVVLLLIFLL